MSRRPPDMTVRNQGYILNGTRETDETLPLLVLMYITMLNYAGNFAQQISL